MDKPVSFDLRSLLLAAEPSKDDANPAQNGADLSGGTPAGVSPNCETSSITDNRSQMAQFLDLAISQEHANSAVAELPSPFSSVLPFLVVLKSQIVQELEGNLRRLLELNVSRREAIAQYLDQLAHLTPGPSTLAGNADAAGGLRRWIEGARSSAQESALQTYFEEIALVVLGQTLLLKAWSDRGLRTWTRQDLSDLNWALTSALKPHVPLDREGWQFTRRNLYSWYIPSGSIQQEIWNRLESFRITDEGPTFLTSLIAPTARARHAHLSGYDPRFFKALWDASLELGFGVTPDRSRLRRAKIAFSPTLRDGAIVRNGPVEVSWIGTEASLFQMIVAELALLWWGPSTPPLWAVGNGLETHSRDQLSLALSSAKPSIGSRIAEMEACDIAFVFEEVSIRGQNRTPSAQRFREQVEALPYFKKMRRASTSLGALQACVALSKLRPGGLLWWAREEPLSVKEGEEMLGFLLEKAKLVREWNFSEVKHSLPVSIPLFSKYLYLFSREAKLEDRLAHRPTQLSVRGQIRSHVELPVLLQDALRPDLADKPTGCETGGMGTIAQFHGQWELQLTRSPTSQQEWAERWPEPASQTALVALEKLRSASLPLAHATTVCATPEGDPRNQNRWIIDPTLKGLWVDCAQDGEQRRLIARAIPRENSELAAGKGFLILVPDDTWTAPLCVFLESEPIREWLDHRAERRNNRWVLDEQTVKWLPIPKTLFEALGVVLPNSDPSTFAHPLPGEWEKLASECAYRPKQVREALSRLPSDEMGSKVRAAIFVRAARGLEQVRIAQTRLDPVIGAQGLVRWRGIMNIIPKAEPIAITLHPEIRITGNLPLHIPIGCMERVKSPANGILLATELGFTLHIGSDQPNIIDLLWEQCEGLQHPTWSELLQYLRVPRRMELAEATASDILRSHGEQNQRAAELVELLSGCTLI